MLPPEHANLNWRWCPCCEDEDAVENVRVRAHDMCSRVLFCKKCRFFFFFVEVLSRTVVINSRGNRLFSVTSIKRHTHTHTHTWNKKHRDRHRHIDTHHDTKEQRRAEMHVHNTKQLTQENIRDKKRFQFFLCINDEENLLSHRQIRCASE